LPQKRTGGLFSEVIGAGKVQKSSGIFRENRVRKIPATIKKVPVNTDCSQRQNQNRNQKPFHVCYHPDIFIAIVFFIEKIDPDEEFLLKAAKSTEINMFA
jgi:hypothetical protein